MTSDAPALNEDLIAQIDEIIGIVEIPISIFATDPSNRQALARMRPVERDRALIRATIGYLFASGLIERGPTPMTGWFWSEIPEPFRSVK